MTGQARPATLRAQVKPIHGSDETLEQLARAASADEAAFDRLVRTCHGRIHRWAVAAVGDADDADDVVQETLLRLHRSLGSFRGDARFTSWLYRITQSAAADVTRRRAGWLRRLVRLSALARPEPQVPMADAAIDAERDVALIRAFHGELPPRQRTVFDLADLQGYRPDEIANMLEMKAVTVRAHLFKARRAIRQRMLRHAPDRIEEEAP